MVCMTHAIAAGPTLHSSMGSNIPYGCDKMLLWASHVDHVVTGQHETGSKILATQNFTCMLRATARGGSTSSRCSFKSVRWWAGSQGEVQQQADV